MEAPIRKYGEKLENTANLPYAVSQNDRLACYSGKVRTERVFWRIFGVPSREGIFPGKIALLIVLAGRASAGLALAKRDDP